MKELDNFLNFIKVNHLKDAAKESIRISRSFDFPLMSRYKHLTDDELVPQATANLVETTDSIIDGTYLSKQQARLEKLKQGLSEGIQMEDITPRDLVMVYAIRRATYRKFLPLFTRDVEQVIRILDDLESLFMQVQTMALSLIFEWEKQAENELRQSNLFLNGILENIPDMIFVKEAKELRFVMFNKAGEKLLGFESKDLIGKNDYDFFPKAQADFFIHKDRAVLESKTLLDIPEEPIQTNHQGERWLHTKKIPLFGPDGNPQYLLGISADISEMKKQTDAIHELNKELEAFSYSVSHDLRAPLRAINGYAQVIQEDCSHILNEETKRLLSAVMRNAEKMGVLIDELLAFSRLGRKDIRKEDVDMNDLLEGVLIELNRSYPNAKIIITEKMPVVRADYGLIHQVMLNLISNAVKYSSKNEKPAVHVKARKEEPNWFISVEDNGVGFDMKYSDKLFGVFQRLHSAEEFEGTGVGLAIVKRIVSRHGGLVFAEGKPGKGATFSFSLPD